MEERNGGGGETAGLRFPNLRKVALFTAAASALSVVIFLIYRDIFDSLRISNLSIPLGTKEGFVVSFLFGFPLAYLVFLIGKVVREGLTLFMPTLPKLALAVVLLFLTPIGNLGLFPYNLAFLLFFSGMEIVGDWPAMLKFFLNFITRPVGSPILVAAYLMSCIAQSGNVKFGGAIWRAVVYLWTVYAGLILFMGIGGI